MRVKAIQDLAQLSDRDLFDQVATGASLCLANARRIQGNALLLAEKNHLRGADILRAAAEEESAKALILLDAIRCPRLEDPSQFARQLQYFNDHLAKGIYAEYFGIRPATFGEVRQWVALVRKEYYLDGPNNVDWIFYNDILRRREENLYVDYVENDGDHLWHDPHHIYGQMDGFGGRVFSPSLRVADALASIGAFAPNALARIADMWRLVAWSDEFHWQELRKLNFRMVEMLNEQGLLLTEDRAILAEIADNWLFPLFSLDLRKDKVDKAQLREIQHHYGLG